MFAPEAHRSLISFNDLRAHGFHLLTEVSHGEETLALRKGPSRLAVARRGASGLYEIHISVPPSGHHSGQPSKGSSYSVIQPGKTTLWHGRLGHPGVTMFRRMLPAITGHSVCTSDANKAGACDACAQGKMSQKPSRWKLPHEMPPPLQRLQGDICGPISPASGPFRYYLVLVDVAGVHFEVSLLSTRNIAFAKILASLIRFRTHFPDHPIKTLRMDNAKEFRSQKFEDYCVATGMSLSYAVPYEHAQNGLAEAFIKKIQLISRPLLLHANLPSSFWSHAVLHAATLLRY